jgi:hypothetical protein
MSRRYELEIIPPSRGEVLAPVDDAGPWTLAPSPSLDGFFSSGVTRWRAGRRTRTLKALTETMVAAQNLFDAETRVIESRIKSREAAYRLQELPDAFESDARRRSAERAEAMRAVEHQTEMAELRRATERAQAEAALVAAEQAAAIQRERGYELASKKQSCEVLDVDLALAERQAILRQHLSEQREVTQRLSGATHVNGGALEEALHQARAQLRASGLDTSALDDILGGRRAQR